MAYRRFKYKPFNPNRRAVEKRAAYMNRAKNLHAIFAAGNKNWWYVGYNMRRTKEAATQAACAEMPEDTFQAIEIYDSITGKMMMRVICFDHITTATTPLPNLYRMKRTSHNYKVIYTENDDAYCMFWSYNNWYYSSSESVIDEEDEL